MSSPSPGSQQQGVPNVTSTPGTVGPQAPSVEVNRFAPAGAIIVMALVLTSFAIMWDSPDDQFQGDVGASGKLVIILLALAEAAVIIPAVAIAARALSRSSNRGDSGLATWLLLALGSLLTLAGIVMGPAAYIWISGLAASDLDSRQPILVAYLVVPLVGVILIYMAARLALRVNTGQKLITPGGSSLRS